MQWRRALTDVGLARYPYAPTDVVTGERGVRCLVRVETYMCEMHRSIMPMGMRLAGLMGVEQDGHADNGSICPTGLQRSNAWFTVVLG